MKKTVCIKNRKYGYIYTTFSDHAEIRLKERKINILDVLYSLTMVSEELCCCYKDLENVVVINSEKNISILIQVNRASNGIYYFNIITVLNFIPLSADGTPAFYRIAKLVTVE